MKKLIRLKKNIKNQTKSYLVAEVAQAHDGSIGFAHSFIYLAKSVGADAVKFQCHIAKEETTAQDKFRKRFSFKKETRYEYWQRMEFTFDEWLGLKKHAEEIGLDFICSIFSKKSLLMMKKLNLKIWKIASGEIFDFKLVKDIAKEKGFLIFSTGMVNYDSVPKLIDPISKINSNIAVLYCRSLYPTPLKEVYLNDMIKLKNEINFPVGISDHSGNPYVPITAISLGAKIVELHLCFNKLQFGPDTSSSLDPSEFKQVSEANETIFKLLNSKNKHIKDKKIEKISNLFTKSLSTNKDLPKGHKLTEKDIVLKKPSTGISPKKIHKVVGKRLIKKVFSKNLLRPQDFE
jgi:N,N'-diacetyllegionaminate synthase